LPWATPNNNKSVWVAETETANLFSLRVVVTFRTTQSRVSITIFGNVVDDADITVSQNPLLDGDFLEEYPTIRVDLMKGWTL
jgi:hypothetical protein